MLQCCKICDIVKVSAIHRRAHLGSGTNGRETVEDKEEWKQGGIKRTTIEKEVL